MNWKTYEWAISHLHKVEVAERPHSRKSDLIFCNFTEHSVFLPNIRYSDEYSYSEEYSVFLRCRIFVFCQNKESCFGTTLHFARLFLLFQCLITQRKRPTPPLAASPHPSPPLSERNDNRVRARGPGMGMLGASAPERVSSHRNVGPSIQVYKDLAFPVVLSSVLKSDGLVNPLLGSVIAGAC